jgi:glyoxylase-like metal-dependent hydrolase (beta-lactamase superfamily II)
VAIVRSRFAHGGSARPARKLAICWTPVPPSRLADADAGCDNPVFSDRSPHPDGTMSVMPRRDFLARSASCATHLALAAAVLPTVVRARWARSQIGSVVAREPFGTLERVADGVWALISTPLTGDRTTLANGGLVAGRDGVLAIEGFYQPKGAEWLAVKARELTGRWPTHVALTHYHADHANGVAGYLRDAARPTIRATETTRDQVLTRNEPTDIARTAALRQVVLLSGSEPTTVDLGGRTIHIIPRSGHTDSDLSLELDDPSVVFCGDLFWNAMFPNYVDAAPTRLASAVRALRRPQPTIYVPGHGALGRADDYDRYAAMLNEVERAAREAHARGMTAVEGAARFSVPASLGEWTLFGKTFFERAFAAWYRELDR